MKINSNTERESDCQKTVASLREDYAKDVKAKLCIAKPKQASEETVANLREVDGQGTVGALPW